MRLKIAVSVVRSRPWAPSFEQSDPSDRSSLPIQFVERARDRVSVHPMLYLGFVEQPQQGLGLTGGQAVTSKRRQQLFLPDDVGLALRNVPVGHCQVRRRIMGHSPD